jgi:nitrate reductase alpha subunit
MNPEDAQALGINDGDYVYVDANPADRPFRGWQDDAARAKVARLMLRVTYNTSYPRGVVMTKHAPFIATEKTVLAHETRPDGRCRSADTGYQANLRYGAQQSCTRNWLMPMHQTDTLLHKAKVKMGFILGGEADNHAVNTVPKETLVRVVKAEAGGPRGQGLWEPATTAFSPHNQTPEREMYLTGGYLQITGQA